MERSKKEKNEDQEDLTLAHFNFQKELNSHAFFKINNHSLGEDLVQETFKKTWSYMVKGGKIDVMKSFLYHILNDLIVDEYRKHKNISLDSLLVKGFEPTSKQALHLFDALDGKTLVLLINTMPPKYKKVLQMKYIQELSIEEISMLTKQTKNTVTVQLHRGLIKLKVLYDLQ